MLWNRKINLTAIRDEAEIAVKHFVDSLTVLPYLAGRSAMLDLGSGGGFPVIPLKIVRPEIEAVSVDAVEKKILFQRQAARVTGLQRFTALHERGERLASIYPGGFDLIVSRAFAEIPTFVGMALPLLAPGGIIVAMKGRGGEDEVASARPYLDEKGVRATNIKKLSLPVAGDARCLVILERNAAP
jgi:16S rRNA (guanine527-N7)-methyltransferase